MVINGKVFDWASVTISFPDFEVELQEISYDDELEKEVAYGKGQQGRGYGTGNYKAEGKMSLLRDDYDDLLAYLKKKGIPLYQLVIPKIVVAYANEGQKTKVDTLNKVTFTKTSNKAAQGDKSLKIDQDFLIVGGINRNGVEAI